MQTTRRILDYVIREMTASEGGFYSSQDADSENEEGKFYIWDKRDIASILGDRTTTEIFCEYYGVTEGGNFEGKNILNIKVSESSLATKHGKTSEQVIQTIEVCFCQALCSQGKTGQAWKRRKNPDVLERPYDLRLR